MSREDIEKIATSRAYITKEVKDLAIYLLEIAAKIDKPNKKPDVGKRVAKVVKDSIIKESK
jgi:hypothetical protein